MTIFNRTRLTNDVFKIDIKRMRKGWYSDKYFENIGVMLSTLAEQKYLFKGKPCDWEILIYLKQKPETLKLKCNGSLAAKEKLWLQEWIKR